MRGSQNEEFVRAKPWDNYKVGRNSTTRSHGVRDKRKSSQLNLKIERVWNEYIKGLSLFLGVMYLLVGALIIIFILQYGLGIAWRFALALLLLDVYGLSEFSQRNRMLQDLADAGSVPLIEGRMAQDT